MSDTRIRITRLLHIRAEQLGVPAWLSGAGGVPAGTSMSGMAVLAAQRSAQEQNHG